MCRAVPRERCPMTRCKKPLIAVFIPGASESLRSLPQYFSPSPEDSRFVLEFLAEKPPSLNGKTPNEFMDGRFVRKFEDEGYFKKVSTK
jgi:hypothetical protein